MNNKGQVLVLSIIFIPIIALLLCLVLDNSIIYYQKKRILNVSKMIIQNNIESTSKDDIIKLYNSNDIKYENIDVSFEDGITINLDTIIKGMYEDYDYHFWINGIKENDKVIFKGNDV